VANPIEVLVPDIGGFKDVSVIDVLVKDGQQIEKETPLITIETEKAAMDVPAPGAGKIVEVKLKTGDKVSEGSLILVLESDGAQGGDGEGSGRRCRATRGQGGTRPASRKSRLLKPSHRGKATAPAKASRARRHKPSQPTSAAATRPLQQRRGRASMRRLSRRPMRVRRFASSRAKWARISAACDGHGHQGPHHAGRRQGLRQRAS
jgi:pyruvate/2-oxoglutarate dehydrogenase complex dihydrolipoamide acyltransferase (E2) component